MCDAEKKSDVNSPSEDELGVPTLYLDQNILGLPLEALISSSRYEVIRDQVAIAYSDETLSEIHRSSGMAESFLSNLDKFKTLRLYPEMNNFSLTGRYIGRFENPRDRLHLMVSENLFASPELTGIKSLQKIYGGSIDLGQVDIVNAQFAALLKSVNADLNNISLDPEVRKLISNFISGQLNLANSVARQNAFAIQEYFNSSVADDPVTDFRKHLNLNPSKLNSIVGDDVLERIWELVRKASPECEELGMQQFFCITGNCRLSGKPLTQPEKVRNIVSTLNLLGYYSDNNLDKDKKLFASVSDLGHAGWGSLCTAIATNDRRFQKRILAAHRYLNLNTVVYGVDLTSDFELIEIEY